MSHHDNYMRMLQQHIMRAQGGTVEAATTTHEQHVALLL